MPTVALASLSGPNRPNRKERQMSQVEEVFIRKEDINSTVMHDLRKYFLKQIMDKLAETHNDWIDLFREKMDYPIAASALVTVLSSCLVEAVNMQGQGIDHAIGADHTLHYQALLQAQNDIERHIEKVRPLCPVADRIDQFRLDNPAIEVGA